MDLAVIDIFVAVITACGRHGVGSPKLGIPQTKETSRQERA